MKTHPEGFVYYPGCSLKGTGKPYEVSLKAVFDRLDVPLFELKDWNCCGATAYMSVDEPSTFVMALRNVAMAEEEEILAPCPACGLALRKSQDYVDRFPELRGQVTAVLKDEGYQLRARTIRHPLDVLVDTVGLDRVRSKVQRPLTGLRVAAYYGCQIVRPYPGAEDPFYPEKLDRLLQALGAQAVAFPLKTRCCGGSLTGTVNEVGQRLNYILLKEAKERGAEIIATLCPLCQFNLECYQDAIARRYRADVRLPVVYFTQLAGWALGVPREALALDALLVPLEGVLEGREGRPSHV